MQPFILVLNGGTALAVPPFSFERLKVLLAMKGDMLLHERYLDEGGIFNN
jgi:hypothetical protein